jgi:DNA-binding response OmpR family regulator
MHARILVINDSELEGRGDPRSIVIQLPQGDRASFEQVLDRLNVALRTDASGLDRITLGNVTIDFRRRRVTSAEADIHLTSKEFDLLRYLGERRDVVVSRDDLLRDVWKYAAVPLTRSVDNAIARLRKKIEPCPQKPMFIHTVHGDGYCLTPSS